MHILDDLKFRGLINQASDEKALRKRLDKGPVTLYIGFDPTADSLHLGNLLMILGLKRFQLAGHQPIGVVGGGTGMIGDPSGKSEERQLNPEETVKEWNKKIKKQIEQFLDFDAKKSPAEMVNNYDWLGKLNYIEFLRDIGKYFNLNDMLDKDSVKSRREVGISLTEFNYQVMQAYDFLQLFENHDCELQLGGSDQWGNIIAGVELIRKKLGKTAYALTFPLVTKADGTKFGKTEGGAIWLDPDKTSPYQFYQFFINTDDRDVIKLMKYYTFLSHDEINNYESQTAQAPEKREAHVRLAQEMTTLVHGEKATKQAEHISQVLFSGEVANLSKEEIEQAFADVPHAKTKTESLVELLCETELASSKRQAREDIEKGAIYINGIRTSDVNKQLEKSDLVHGTYIILRRGKKNYYLVEWK